MANNTPQQAVTIVAIPLTWRKVSKFHQRMGARVIRQSPLVLTAAAPLNLINAPYGPDTIDRIIGCYLSLGQAGAGTITLQELNSGWNWSVVAGTQLGNYWFPIETLVDGANITITSSINIAAAKQASISFYNFEMPPAQMGHE